MKEGKQTTRSPWNPVRLIETAEQLMGLVGAGPV